MYCPGLLPRASIPTCIASGSALPYCPGLAPRAGLPTCLASGSALPHYPGMAPRAGLPTFLLLARPFRIVLGWPLVPATLLV